MKGDEKLKKLLVVSVIVVALLTLSMLTAVSGATTQITIDGVISAGEWDAYYLGTSVTTWQGGMSVDVYGFADDTYLYVAYKADKTQPGWAVAESLFVDCNLYYSTVKGDNLLDTLFQMWASGESYQVVQTEDWATWDELGTLETVGVEYYYVSMWDPPDNQGVAEFKIPLGLIVIEGATQIELYGQYWQYDWATLFYVELPPPLWFKASGGGVSYSDAGGTYGHFCTLGVIGISLETTTGIGPYVPCKGSGTFIDHKQKIKVSFNIEEGSIRRADYLIYFKGTAKVFDIEGHTKYYDIPFRVGLVDNQYSYSNRFDFAITFSGTSYYWHGTLLPDSEVTVWVWEA